MEIDKKLKKFSKEFFSKSLNFLEIKYIENKEGESIFTCNFKDTYSNPMGSVQGGMITAALDDATSAVMISGYDEKKVPLTTDLHVLFHRPLEKGTAVIKVKIIKLGRKSSTSEGRIFNKEDKLVATLLHSAQPIDLI